MLHKFQYFKSKHSASQICVCRLLMAEKNNPNIHYYIQEALCNTVW